MLPKRKAESVPIDIDKPRLEWVMRERSKELAVTNMDVRREALEMAEKNGRASFKASDHWIWNSKKRTKLVFRVPTHTTREATFTD